jgi:protein-S-isoprenylcysteine O-methyltransferase Ste14
VFVLNYLLGAALHTLWPIRLPWPLPVDPSIVGAVVFVLGVLVAGAGWLTFYRAGTTRVPGERSTALVTWGPYRVTRNPMYVGLSIAYLGEAGLLHQLWPVLLLPLTMAYLDRLVIPVEESRLHEVFGDAYDAYRARVRRWL